MNTMTPMAGNGVGLGQRIKNLCAGLSNDKVGKAESNQVEQQLNLATEKEKQAKGKFDQGALGVVEAKKKLETQKKTAETDRDLANQRAQTAAAEAAKAQQKGDAARQTSMQAQLNAQITIKNSKQALVDNLNKQLAELEKTETNMVTGSIKLGAQVEQHQAENAAVVARNQAAEGKAAAQNAMSEIGAAQDGAAAIRARAMHNVEEKEAKVDAHDEFASRTSATDLDSIASDTAADQEAAAMLAKAGFQTPAAPAPAAAAQPPVS